MPIKFARKDHQEVVADLIQLAEQLDKLIGEGEGNWRAKVAAKSDLTGNKYLIVVLEHGKYRDLTLQRRMYIETVSVQKFIEHMHFALPEELQGKGLADPVMDFSRKQAERFGIDIIKLYANLDVGGYAWLRKGFMPHNAMTWLSTFLKKKIEAPTVKTGKGKGDLLSPGERKALAGKLLDLIKDMDDDGLQELFLSEQFREFKPLFLNSSWFGQADLTNPKVRKALFKYDAPPGAAPSVIDNATRHAVMLERLKAAEARDFNRLVPILEKQVTDILASLKVKSLSELDRGAMNATLRLLRQAQDDAAKGATDRLLARLTRIAEYEAKFEATTLQQFAAAAGTTASITPALPAAAWALANAVPLSATGDLLGPWVKEMTAEEVAQINKVILRGYSEGWTNDDLLSILRGTKAMNYSDGLLTRMGKHNATIVRTAIQHVASTAREATWRANDDLIDKYRWVSTLDSRTSPQCRSLDGQEFEIGKGPRPPIHPNCRSTTIAILKGKLRVLSEGRTRASMDGPVNSTLTYYEWLSKQSASFQKDVLGPSRYKIFKSTGMTAEKFARLQLNSAFEPLTLEELEALL